MQTFPVQAVVMTQTGAPEVLRAAIHHLPAPAPGQVRVRLAATGVNYIDVYKRNGSYPAALPLPGVPGQEGAGVVEALGDETTEVRLGQRVAYCNVVGSYAQAANVPADRLIPLPDTLSFEQGAAFALQGMTAHYLVHEYVDLGPGRTVLVHAAAGGVGLLVVQWAKHLGARVFGTASSERKARFAREAGAEAVFVTPGQDFLAETHRLTGGRGADLVLDSVGHETLKRSVTATADRGTVVSYGFPSGLPDPVAPATLITRSLRLAGGNLIPFTASREDLLRRANAVLVGVAAGWLKLRVEAVLPLVEAAEAHRRLESRTTAGKLVLKI